MSSCHLKVPKNDDCDIKQLKHVNKYNPLCDIEARINFGQ